MLKLIPTQHAVERAKDRTGWCRQALERMLDRVYYSGMGPGDCHGTLREYLDSVSFSEKTPFIRLYGGHVFVFGHGGQADERILITILHLPLELRALAHRARSRLMGVAA